MSSNAPPIQDMPPKGGYEKINFARVPAKKLLSGVKIIAGVLVFHALSAWGFVNITRPAKNHRELEERSSAVVMYPFFKAEKDRRMLLQLHKNREAEEELMKDVEGWEVGKYQGEPIYKTLAKDEWFEPMIEELFVHSPPSDFRTLSTIAFRR